MAKAQRPQRVWCVVDRDTGRLIVTNTMPLVEMSREEARAWIDFSNEHLHEVRRATLVFDAPKRAKRGGHG